MNKFLRFLKAVSITIILFVLMLLLGAALAASKGAVAAFLVFSFVVWRVYEKLGADK